MMKVLLIDVDSKVPNLALMKLSAWHKKMGDEVGFSIANPNKVYASVIFKKNRHKVDGLRFYYPDADIVIGGSGYDLEAKLPDYIEKIRPDYTLYPGMDYSMGFTSRGCVRHCYFCIVPKKEGKYARWQHPAEFVSHDKVKLLDNNWYADREWFFSTSEWFLQNKIAVDVTQGMDIRLLDQEIADQLVKMKWWATLHFAFDNDRDEEAVIDGIKMLKNAGIDTRQKVFFYVYCHDDDHYESALHRCHVLKENRAGAFVMFNIDNERSTRVKHLQRWANKPQLFWMIDIKQLTYNSKKWGASE